MKVLRQVLAVLAVTLLMAACATQGPAVEEPVELDDSARLAAADHLARVIGLRQQAVELEAEKRLADDFRLANGYLQQGQSAYDLADYPATHLELDQAEPRFLALIDASYQQIIEEEKILAEQAYAEALEAGAQQWAYDILVLAEAAYDRMLAAEEAGNQAATLAALRELRVLLDGANTRSRASRAKLRIDELSFAEHDADNYRLAKARLAEADSLWPTRPQAALEGSEEALLRFNLVLQKGWETMAGRRRVQAESGKSKADELKAAVAVAAIYRNARTLYESAIQASAKGDNEYASSLFAEAEELFLEAWQQAVAKRDAADAAMAAALARQSQSRQVAQDADQVLGLEDDTVILDEPDSDQSIEVELLEDGEAELPGDDEGQED